MSVPVLPTKLYIPPVRTNAVARSRLVEKLLSGMERPGGFSLVSAPPGFGKTTLLVEAVARLRGRVAWASLDEGDNAPDRFWRALIAACQSIAAGAGEDALELLHGFQALSDDILPSLLINDLIQQAMPLVLILDDYHTIREPSIHAGVQFLLDHLPPSLHIVISTRTDPPWPLARFRASNRLVEIRAQDLRFRMEEAVQFLNHTMGLNLNLAEVNALEEKTEGWAAGLQLAALSIQGRSDAANFVKAFTGSNLYVAEYLVEEVLQQQPQEIQSFLLQTSILERLSAELCEAVSGCSNGQAILTSLLRANVFVVALDHEGQWFRYHQLFSDLLRSRLSSEMVPALHRRASIWYEHHGFAQEAFQHALAGKDFERAAHLLENTAHALIFAGRLNLVRSWLEAMPAAAFREHPRLAFFQFWIAALQNKADLSERSLYEKEEMLKKLPPSPENDRLRGELMAVVCRAVALSGRTSEGIRLAQEALAYLPPDDLASRARASSALAAAQELEGRSEMVEPIYQDCFRQALAAGDYRLAASAMMIKGFIQYQRGYLHDAASTFQAIIDLGVRSGGLEDHKRFLPAGQGYIGLGLVNLEWGNLAIAEDYLKQGLELCRRGGLDGIFFGRVQLSRLYQAKGDLRGALKEIRQLEKAVPRVDDFYIPTRNIQIALAKNDVVNAWRWAAPLVEMIDGVPGAPRPPLLFFEIIEAILVRVSLAQGQAIKALALLDKIESTAGAGQRLARLVEVHLLKALALQPPGRANIPQAAIEQFRLALELAGPEDFTLLFLEEGPALIPLLTAVAADSGAPDHIRSYVHKLLSAFGQAQEQAAPKIANLTQTLVEPLTRREMEVLELLASGQSNQEIAEELVIAVRTVKKHTSNIYGKLGVASRIQAVARARELGLLAAG